jgi:hypothetical protein
MNSTLPLTRIVLPAILLVASVGAGQEIWSMEDTGLTSYEFGTIVSLGADGTPQFDYDTFELGASHDDANSHSHPNDDIIYTNGIFVSWPATIPLY